MVGTVARRAPQAVLLAVVVLAAAACSATGGSAWTFPPSTSGGSGAATASPAAPSGSTPSGSPVASATASPSPSAAPTVTPIDFTPGTVASPRVIKVTADDQLNFNPGAIVAVEGETVTFQIQNLGKAEHEFKIGPADDVITDKESAPEIPSIMPGRTEAITYTFTGAGPFAFACHAPGHFEHGMMGWILLVGPDVPTIGTKANPRIVWIDMSDKLRFDPDTVAVRPGETVRFVLTNSGTVTHEFQVGPGDKVAADLVDGVIVQESDSMDAGSTHALVYTFAAGAPTADAPYAFACHEPGHYQAGMKGIFTVSGP